MALIARSTGSDMEPISPGMHPAVCYGVVDLGTQPAFGNFPPKHKVLFLFELPEERADFTREDKKVNLPRAISCTFTLSLHTKGNMRPALEGWRGREFTPQELEGFNVMQCLSANALLNVTHKSGSGKNAGRTFAEIKSINPLPKGTKKRQPENPLLQFSLDDFQPGNPIVKPANMPDWIWARVTQADEYIRHEQRHNPAHPPQGEPSDAEMANLADAADAEEEIPF
jgi:hypothetical protein